MEIDVSVESGLEGCPETGWLRSVAGKALAAQGVKNRAELGLVIVGQEKIRQLNLSYLEKDEPTDVLSFSMLPEQPDGGPAHFVAPPDGIEHLGEVIISYPQAVIQAEEHQHSVKRETAILMIHGVLHLLGYDHDKPEPEQQMKAKEAETLGCIEGELG